MRRLSLLLTLLFLLAGFSACGKAPSAGSAGTSEEATEEPTAAPVESAPLLSELSEELRAEIGGIWQNEFGEEFVCRTEWGNEDVSIFYYGTYQGLPVFFRSPVIDAMVSGYLRIGGVELGWGHPFQIYAYKDGALHKIATLYAQKLLTEKDIKQIAEVQKYFGHTKESNKK